MSSVIAFILCQVYVIHSTVCQQLPRSPCPSIFNYELADYLDPSSHYSSVKGVINVEPPLPIFLKVKLQIPTTLFRKYDGRLELADTKSQLLQKIITKTLDIIKYNLYFPSDKPMPQIILIQVNSKVLCSSVPVSSQAFTIVTLDHSLMPVTHTTSVEGGTEGFNPNDFGKFKNKTRGSEDLPQNRPLNNFENVPPPRSPSVAEEKTTSKLPFLKMTTSFPFLKTTTTKINIRKTTAVPDFLKTTVSRTTVKTTTSWTPIKMNLSRETCGKPIRSNALIVHGTSGTRGDWPWMVPLFKKTDLGLQFICSSTLVSKRFIMTAAHCLKFQANTPLTHKDLVAYVGRFNIRNWAEDHNQPREISEIFLHPEYDPYSLYSDLALLELAGAVSISPYVNPACVWTGDEDLNKIVGSRGIVFGWGFTDVRRKISDTPRLAFMPIVSQEDCLRSKLDFVFLTSNRTLCAGFKNGTGPCNGDSGGGLMLSRKGEDGSTRWYVRGVTSLSLKREDENNNPCNLDEYAVFTDVAKYQEWLSKYI